MMLASSGARPGARHVGLRVEGRQSLAAVRLSAGHRMVALAHEQAKDHLAEASLIRQRNLQKAQPDRCRAHGADHRRFDSDRLVFPVGFEHETQERSPRQAGGLEGAAIHRNVRNPIGRPYSIVCKKLRLD